MSDHFDEQLNLPMILANENRDYFRKLGMLADWADRYLENPLIKDYTDHSVTHSKRVMENIDRLTITFMENEDRRMCDKEIYILLAACCSDAVLATASVIRANWRISLNIRKGKG